VSLFLKPHPVGRMPNATATIVVFLFIIPSMSAAIGEVEDDDGNTLYATGSQRLTGVYLHYPEGDVFPDGDDGMAASVTRLMLDGDLGEEFTYELNFYTDITRMPDAQTGGAFATAGVIKSPYRARYVSWDFWDDGSMDGQLGLDRLNFTYRAERISLTAGRQVINYSVTQIFTPNDFFAPFSATAINKIYKPGVDGVSMSITAGELATIDITGVMGSDPDDVPDWDYSAFLVRGSTIVENYEWAIMSGKLARRWIAGTSLQGEAGPLNVRFEGHVGAPDIDGQDKYDEISAGTLNDDVHVRFAAGIDSMFVWQNASVGAEYMFISDGVNDAAWYVNRSMQLFPDDLMMLGEHYAGVTAGLDAIPILRLQTMGLLNCTDYSGLAALTLIYNISDEADFVGGLMAPWGQRPVLDLSFPSPVPVIKSEFGLMPLMTYLETRFYF